ncbi:unnamed protein product [Ectocarpus sp. CCAP 1310/34]|nr:unnamed protein product [Ectocarpus sp. CCAP 1310/34]
MNEFDFQILHSIIIMAKDHGIIFSKTGGGMVTIRSPPPPNKFGFSSEPAIGCTMDAITLVAYTFEVGSSLLERCGLVKQCHTESGRIAVRAARVLGALQRASDAFSCRMEFEASLRELKRVLEEARDLVSRCQMARGVGAKIGALMGANSLKAGLVRVEGDLDRVAADLQIPMLTDIRRAVQCINERESDAAASPSGIDAEMLEQAVRDAIRKELCNASQGRAVDDIIKDNLSKLYEAEAAVAADQQGYSSPPGGAGGSPVLCSGHGEECALRTTKKEVRAKNGRSINTAELRCFLPFFAASH